MNLNTKDIDFILESLKWAQMRFEEKSTQYRSIDGYYQNQFKPKIEQFNQTKTKLRELKKEAVNDNSTD